MKRVISSIAFLLLLAAGQAFGFSLGGYSGPVELKFNGYTKSADNTYDNLRPGGSQPGETWGIINLTSIETPGGSMQLWSKSSSGESIVGMIWGLYDTSVTPGPFGVTVNQIGGHFALYLDSTPAGNYDTGLGPAGRTAINQFNTVTNTPGSTLWLAGSFGPGVSTVDPTATVVQDLNVATAPARGSGSGYADVTGGAFASTFNSNALLGGHDLHFLFDVQPAVNNVVTAPDESQLWSQYINDPTEANVVPEPSTIILLGAGLAGLGFFSRRRKS